MTLTDWLAPDTVYEDRLGCQNSSSAAYCISGVSNRRDLTAYPERFDQMTLGMKKDGPLVWRNVYVHAGARYDKVEHNNGHLMRIERPVDLIDGPSELWVSHSAAERHCQLPLADRMAGH